MNKSKLYRKYLKLIKSGKCKLGIRKLSLLSYRGHLNSQKYLSKAYYYGKYVSENYEKAAKWTRYACLQGDADSQFLLGLMYEEGNGLEQNTLKAINWKKRAALQSHERAIVSLGIIYLWGNDSIKENKKEALKWFRKGAKIKSSQCYYYLSLIIQVWLC